MAATCDIKTITESNVSPFIVNGIEQISNNEAMEADMLSQYHLCKLRDKSTIGPQTKRHRFAEIPIATIPAVSATEKPFCVSINGNVTVTKPWLIPIGMIRKNI